MAVTDNDKMPSGKSIVSTDKFVGAGIEVIDIHAVWRMRALVLVFWCVCAFVRMFDSTYVAGMQHGMHMHGQKPKKNMTPTQIQVSEPWDNRVVQVAGTISLSMVI